MCGVLESLPWSAMDNWPSQGISQWLIPGCENVGWKNSVFLPAEGKQTATFSPDYTQPGKSLLDIPCTSWLNLRKKPSTTHHRRLQRVFLILTDSYYPHICTLFFEGDRVSPRHCHHYLSLSSDYPSLRPFADGADSQCASASRPSQDLLS